MSACNAVSDLPLRGVAISLHGTRSFLYVANSVDWYADLLDQATGPANLEVIDLRSSSDSEVNAPGALACVSVPAVELANLSRPSGLHLDTSTDTIPVRLGADQLKLDPVPDIL